MREKRQEPARKSKLGSRKAKVVAGMLAALCIMLPVAIYYLYGSTNHTNECANLNKKYVSKINRLNSKQAHSIIQEYQTRSYCIKSVDSNSFKQLSLQDKQNILQTNYILAKSYMLTGQVRKAQSIADNTIAINDHGLTAEEREKIDHQDSIILAMMLIR